MITRYDTYRPVAPGQTEDVTELVARLRHQDYEDPGGDLLDRAADALERMAAENTQLTLRLGIAAARLAAAEELSRRGA